MLVMDSVEWLCRLWIHSWLRTRHYYMSSVRGGGSWTIWLTFGQGVREGVECDWPMFRVVLGVLCQGDHLRYQL